VVKTLPTDDAASSALVPCETNVTAADGAADRATEGATAYFVMHVHMFFRKYRAHQEGYHV